jgi:hypothetical protein
MKTYIREMLDDLKVGRKDYIPPMPKPLKDAKTIDLDVPPPAPLASDLDDQELSKDAAEEVRQLDWQAQQKVQNPGH